MPPRRKKPEEAVVVILDVGSTEEDNQTPSSSFFQRAKVCLLGLIKKKIFAQSQELITLILMNSDETLNDLNSSTDGYNNISIVYPLRLVSWDLARLVDRLIPTRRSSVDWLDAMEVALNDIQRKQETDLLILSNIVLISTLAGTADADQANNILRLMKTLASELTVIGYGVDQIKEVSKKYSQSKQKSLGRLQENLAILSNMVGKMNSGDHKNSALCSFDETLSHLSFFKGKPVRPIPWRADLEIGTEINFEVIGYKMIAEQEWFNWSTQKRSDTITTIYKDVKNYTRMNDEGGEQEVAQEEIVLSYNYGDKIIPFSSYDRETMSYKSGPRSLKLISVTKKRNVPKYILQGTAVNIFTCGKESAAAFAAFHVGLESSQSVGLVRRVYNRDSAPTIGTLYPEYLDGKKVFTFIELPFAEDEVKLKFPSLKHVSPTTEQKSTINKLIDMLDLSDSNVPDSELFCPEKTFDPHGQFMYYVCSQKMLLSEDESPLEPPEHIAKLLNLPPEMKSKAEPIIEKIKSLFPLLEVEEKEKKNKTSDDSKEGKENDNQNNENQPSIEQPGVSALFKPTVVQVTTLQPVQDFEMLLEKGESHSEVCNQMKKVITVLAQRIVELDDLLKLIRALKTLRKSCFENNYGLYNSWLPELKNLARERNLESLWEKINEEHLGLISNKETAISNISEEDANSFLKFEDSVTEVELEVNGDDLMMEL